MHYIEIYYHVLDYGCKFPCTLIVPKLYEFSLICFGKYNVHIFIGESNTSRNLGGTRSMSYAFVSMIVTPILLGSSWTTYLAPSQGCDGLTTWKNIST